MKTRLGGFDAATIRLDIPSRIEMLQTADVLVGEIASAAGFAEASTRDVQTACNEAVINAIVHGNQLDDTLRVRLEVVIHPGALRIRVRDEGPGFDATCVPNPLAPENLRKPSGRGVFLMRALMDEVVFRYAASGGTQVTMLKRREPKRTARGAADLAIEARP